MFLFENEIETKVLLEDFSIIYNEGRILIIKTLLNNFYQALVHYDIRHEK